MPYLPVPASASAQTNTMSGTGSAVNPVNFLLAAADLHQQAPQSAPVPRGSSRLGAPASRPRRSPQALKVVR